MRLNPSSAIRSHLRRLTMAVLACGLAWAAPPARASFPGANGKILFMGDGQARQFLTINPDGSGETALPPHQPAAFQQAEWSADGSRIAFSGGEDHADVYTMNADGTGQVSVTGLGGTPWQAGAPTWAPSGTQLAYQRTEPGGPDTIWTINSDGSDPTQITTVHGDSFPAWSPDGGTIAFPFDRSRPHLTPRSG